MLTLWLPNIRFVLVICWDHGESIWRANCICFTFGWFLKDLAALQRQAQDRGHARKPRRHPCQDCDKKGSLVFHFIVIHAFTTAWIFRYPQSQQLTVFSTPVLLSPRRLMWFSDVSLLILPFCVIIIILCDLGSNSEVPNVFSPLLTLSSPPFSSCADNGMIDHARALSWRRLGQGD